MQLKIEDIKKWLRGSGLTVSWRKTKLCLFCKRDEETIELTINDVRQKIVTQ